jgi:hypothetical protein
MIIDCSIVNLEPLGWSREYQPLLIQTIIWHGSFNVTVDDCSAYQEQQTEYQKEAFFSTTGVCNVLILMPDKRFRQILPKSNKITHNGGMAVIYGH